MSSYEELLASSGLVYQRSAGFKPLAQMNHFSNSAPAIRINRKLLHPEEKLCRRSIPAWVDSLNAGLAKLQVLEHVLADCTKLAVSINQATFIMGCVNRVDDAYRYCKLAIRLFNNLACRGKLAEARNFCVQPWINLSRLDRLVGNCKQSLARLILLSGCGTPESDEATIVATAIQVNTSTDIKTVIDNAIVLDGVKTCLRDSRYQFLAELSSLVKTNTYHKSVIAEAKIIACCTIGQYDEACEIAINEYNNGLPIAMPLFMYRLLELVVDNKQITIQLEEKLYSYLARKSLTEVKELHELFFMQQVYMYLYKRAQIYVSHDVFERIKHQFSQQGEEVALLECMKFECNQGIITDEECNSALSQSCYAFLSKAHGSSRFSDTTAYESLCQHLERLASIVLTAGLRH